MLLLVTVTIQKAKTAVPSGLVTILLAIIAMLLVGTTIPKVLTAALLVGTTIPKVLTAALSVIKTLLLAHTVAYWGP